MDRKVSIAAGVLTALAVLLVTYFVALNEHGKHVNAVRFDTVKYASLARAKLEGALNTRLHLAYGLGAYGHTTFGDLNLDGFEEYAKSLAESGIPGVRSFQLAPDAVVRHVYPLEGNRAAIGHDLLRDDARRAAVQQSIDQRLFLLAGPFKLIQGGTGLVARLPLYRDPPDDRFWGFATVVVDFDPILAEAGIHPPANPSYLIAIRGKDGAGAAGDVFFGDSKTFQQEAILTQVNLPHGSWELAVLPQGGWPRQSPNRAFIWFVGALLAYFAGTLAFVRVNEPTKLRREVDRVTRSLAERENQFRQVAESASDAIVSFDQAGQITFWNAAAERLFGLSPGDALDSPVDALLPKLDRQRLLTQTGSPVEMIAIHSDHSEFPVELALAQWAAGKRIFYTAIIRDITDRKLVEREQAILRERYYHTQKMDAIGQLASGTAHEFNNILSSLIANTEAAMAALPPDSPSQSHLFVVMDCGWRAAEIVQQLQVFSEQTDLPEPLLSPHAALTRLMMRLKAQLPANVRLVDDIEPVPGRIGLVYDQFCHLIWNLTMNACKAMLPEGGTLRIGLTQMPSDDANFRANSTMCDHSSGCSVIGQLKQGTYICLTVRDTGCGMDAATLSRIFDPFFTTSAVGAGSGLGLSMVHGIVQKHGGGILACSSEGKGTTFRVYLPVVDNDPDATLAAPGTLAET